MHLTGDRCRLQRARASVLVQVLFVAGSLPLLAVQDPPTRLVRISSRPSCPDCRITIDAVVRLGDPDGEGMISHPPYVARDRRGRYYVTSRQGSDQVPLVFDSQGHFLQRLGRPGGGPGEFRGADAILVVNDSIVVFDVGNARMTVLSPDYRPVRSAPIPPVSYAAAASGRTIFLNARVPDRSRIGLSLHRMDFAGNYLGSHGDSAALVLPRRVESLLRLATSHLGGVWVAPELYDYRLERWTTQGVRVTTIIRDAEWYPPYDKVWSATPTTAPPPTITAVWEDAGGLLWVFGTVAAPRWWEGLGPGQLLEGRRVYPTKAEDDVLDAVVEVIDPTAGRLVTSRRFDAPLRVALGNSLASSMSYNADGVLKVQVWRLRLNPPTRRPP